MALCRSKKSLRLAHNTIKRSNRGAPRVTEVPEEVDHPMTLTKIQPFPRQAQPSLQPQTSASPAAPPTVCHSVGTATDTPPSSICRTASRSSLQPQQITLKLHLNPKVSYWPSMLQMTKSHSTPSSSFPQRMALIITLSPTSHTWISHD